MMNRISFEDIARKLERLNNDGGKEAEEGHAAAAGTHIWLRVQVSPGAMCSFYHSSDGKAFSLIGKPFAARAGPWIGAKVGLFRLQAPASQKQSYADFDWFRFH